MQVNPEKAKKRREHGARQARVQRWAEPSGNAGLTGRELPPAEVLAADQRITWWARQLRRAGLDGGMGSAPGSRLPGHPARHRLVPSSAEWPEWRDEPGYLAAQCEDDPGDGDRAEYEDPDNAPPPGMDDAQLATLIAEAEAFTAGQAEAEAEMARAGQAGIRAALGSVAAGRRGPGMPGSAQRFPGEYTSRASGFASGKPLDVAPGGPVLAEFADEAAGEGDRFGGASDDELVGVICGVGPGRGRCLRPQARRGGGADPPPSRARPARSTARPGCRGRGMSSPPGAGCRAGRDTGDAEEVLALAAALEVKLARDPGGVPGRCAAPG